MVTEMICIGCPLGCNLTVTHDNLDVAGNQCPIGDKYGKEEMTNPMRNITSSVRVEGGDSTMLSVKTGKPIPKSAVMDCMKAIRQITVAAPVKIGDVVLANAAGSGSDIVATREVCVK